MATREFSPTSPEVGVFTRMLARQTVQIAPAPGKYPVDFEIPLGSGVIVSRGRKNFVLTVRHTFETLEPTRFMVNFADRDLRIIDQREYERAVASKVAQPGEMGRVLSAIFPQNRRIDLALLEIGALPSWCTSVTLGDEKFATVRQGQSVTAYGMPREAGTTVLKPGAIFHHARSFMVCGDLVDPGPLQNWKEGFLPSRHFAMTYDRRENPALAVKPEGMRGCGVWRLTQGPGGTFMRYDWKLWMTC